MNFVLVLLVCALGGHEAFPSKPLNERPPEDWQAWFLFDQAHSRLAPGGNVAHKRITPKSVFIAPTFTPESLPPCADGYESDPMGLCLKIVKMDKVKHLEFLMDQIRHKFPPLNVDYDYEDNDDIVDGSKNATPEPLKINIPLGNFHFDSNSNQPDYRDDDYSAIVVTRNYEKAPSNVDVKRNGGDKFTVKNVAEILGVKPEEVTMTTFEAFTSTQRISSMDEPSTIQTSTVSPTGDFSTLTSTLPADTTTNLVTDVTDDKLREEQETTTVLPTTSGAEGFVDQSDGSTATTESIGTTTVFLIKVHDFNAVDPK